MAGQNAKSIFETIFRREDSGYVYAEVNAGLTTYEGEAADLVIIRDMTERNQPEEVLQRAPDDLD